MMITLKKVSIDDGRISMRDQFGRVNNKAQAIRDLDKLRLAILLDDIKKNSDKYPDSRNDWVEWLNEDSGDRVDQL